MLSQQQYPVHYIPVYAPQPAPATQSTAYNQGSPVIYNYNAASASAFSGGFPPAYAPHAPTYHQTYSYSSALTPALAVQYLTASATPQAPAQAGEGGATHMHPTTASHRTRCMWGACGIVLDDTSGGGVLRHLKEFHPEDLQSSGKVQCQWDACKCHPLKHASIGKHVAGVHMRRVNMKECSRCGTQFSRTDALLRHERAQHGEGKRRRL